MPSSQPVSELVDLYGRVARKLRLSVTDKCNFRCNFCMPETPQWIANENVLTFEEILRLVTILSSFGVDRVRLSGGEPLVRRDIEVLMDGLSSLGKIKRLGMTTNGYFLSEKAEALEAAGLQSVTVSLHSLRRSRFAAVTQRDAHERVLAGIRAAKDAGFESVKINAVVIRGYNDDEILDFASLAHEQNLNVRFIEYMPFDGKRMWGMDKVVSGEEIRSKIASRYEIMQLERESGSTAVNYRFRDGAGEFGIITSITKPFCSDCDRIRLTADGKIIPCLFDTHQYDVAMLLRNGASDEDIAEFFRKTVRLKTPGVEHLIRQSLPLQHVRPMYVTGG